MLPTITGSTNRADDDQAVSQRARMDVRRGSFGDGVAGGTTGCCGSIAVGAARRVGVAATSVVASEAAAVVGRVSVGRSAWRGFGSSQRGWLVVVDFRCSSLAQCRLRRSPWSRPPECPGRCVRRSAPPANSKSTVNSQRDDADIRFAAHRMTTSSCAHDCFLATFAALPPAVVGRDSRCAPGLF